MARAAHFAVPQVIRNQRRPGERGAELAALSTTPARAETFSTAPASWRHFAVDPDMGPDIEELLRSSSGVIRRADHPHLARRLDRLRRAGQLESPLRGVFWLPGCADEFAAGALAGQLWAGRDAVLTGEAAARLSFWPDLRADRFDYAIPRRQAVSSGRWHKGYRIVPPEFVTIRDGVAITRPSMTAVDLAAGDRGGDAIDQVLRTRTGTLDQMWQAFALQPNRLGNERRGWLLRDSRNKPWSECERALHRLQRRHHVTGWRANAWVAAGTDGYYVDVLFAEQRLIIEADGWEFHSSRAAFENDRRRRNELVLAGYRVLNFTWRQITEDPEWVIGCICRALAE